MVSRRCAPRPQARLCADGLLYQPTHSGYTHQGVDVGRARQAVAARRTVLAAFRPHGRQEPRAERQQPSAESQEPRHRLQEERDANSERAGRKRSPSERPLAGTVPAGGCRRDALS